MIIHVSVIINLLQVSTLLAYLCVMLHCTFPSFQFRIVLCFSVIIRDFFSKCGIRWQLFQWRGFTMMIVGEPFAEPFLSVKICFVAEIFSYRGGCFFRQIIGYRKIRERALHARVFGHYRFNRVRWNLKSKREITI